jgi:hypothetical protein
MLKGNYYLTILVYMLVGGFVGTVIGAVFGYAGHEVGWWGVGLLLGLLYGTITGCSVTDQP